MNQKTRVILLIAALAVLLAVSGWLVAGRQPRETPAGASSFVPAEKTAVSAQSAAPGENSDDAGGCCGASVPSAS